MQMIGWDPASKQIRSWNFEADGGFGESVWTKDGTKWLVKTKAVGADGSAITATNIITPLDAKTVSWQSKERTAGGKSLPDTKETKMKRVEE
jgi:beta-lactamase class A